MIDLNVAGIDSLSGNLSLRYFGGATSGYYQFIISASDIGRINTEEFQLLIVSKITGISPRTGSSLGGTLLTIEGENFSNDATDHVVTVGDNRCEIV